MIIYDELHYNILRDIHENPSVTYFSLDWAYNEKLISIKSIPKTREICYFQTFLTFKGHWFLHQLGQKYEEK